MGNKPEYEKFREIMQSQSDFWLLVLNTPYFPHLEPLQVFIEDATVQAVWLGDQTVSLLGLSVEVAVIVFSLI